MKAKSFVFTVHTQDKTNKIPATVIHKMNRRKINIYLKNLEDQQDELAQ